MKLYFDVLLMSRLFLGFVLLVLGAARSQASTLWTGPNTNFVQSAATPVDELIPGVDSLQRNYAQWLFNPDAGDQGPGPGTPTDTLWAFGTLANYQSLSYATFDSYRDGDLSALIVSNPMVVHLIKKDVYLSVMFTVWPKDGGYFAYIRSTPAMVSTPSVTLTNPAANTVFAAPANVKIGATASVAGGSVTNVAFFANNNLLGAAQSAPFSITSGSLAAGAYALTAVATAAGNSATSTVVNISIVSPATNTLSLPEVTNGQFVFSYVASPGLSYVVQDSSNLVNWVSLATNIAGSNLVKYTGNALSHGGQYYRVSRLPNP